MNIRYILLPLLCTMLPVPTAFAKVHDTTSTHHDLTAKQVIAKNIEVRGGIKAWRAVDSMTMTGKIDAGKLRTKPPVPLYNFKKTRFDPDKKETEAKVIQLPFVMELKRPLKMRFELSFQGDTAVQAFDGKNGWKLRPFLGRKEVEPFTKQEMTIASQQQELDGFLIDYAAKGTKVESEGMDKVEGNDAYKLKLTLKDGNVRHVWVDAKTFLETKVDGSRIMDGKPRAVATYLRDYKQVEGLKIPFTMETSVEGVKDTEKISIQKVALNTKLADTLFSKPK